MTEAIQTPPPRLPAAGGTGPRGGGGPGKDRMTGSGSLGASEALQLDVISDGAATLLPLLLENLDPAKREGAGALLAAWDFEMSPERPEPLIFATWTAMTAKRLLQDELGEDLAKHWRGDYDVVAEILKGGTQWCDDLGTEAAESCRDQVTAALDEALAELKGRFGEDVAGWRWGEAHVARFHHPVLRHAPLIGDLFGFPVETGGGSYTVNRGGARFATEPDQRFEHVHGPGLRAVYDLADLDNSRFMIATGQSGNPLSPHYGSFAERWRDGVYLKLVGPEKEPAHRLILNPR